MATRSGCSNDNKSKRWSILDFATRSSLAQTEPFGAVSIEEPGFHVKILYGLLFQEMRRQMQTLKLASRRRQKKATKSLYYTTPAPDSAVRGQTLYDTYCLVRQPEWRSLTARVLLDVFLCNNTMQSLLFCHCSLIFFQYWRERKRILAVSF